MCDWKLSIIQHNNPKTWNGHLKASVGKLEHKMPKEYGELFYSEQSMPNT